MENKKLIVASDLNKEILMSKVRDALPAGVNLTRFAQCAMAAIMEDRNLASAPLANVIKELIKAARVGLIPDGQEAAIINFKGNPKFMPMVRGLISLARRSGEVKSIGAHLIREGDEFFVEHTQHGTTFTHRPDMFSKGEIKGVFAVAVLNNGQAEIEVLSMEDVDAIKAASMIKSDRGPWGGPFKTEMYKKAAIKRLIKRLPYSADYQRAVDSDNETFDLKSIPAESATKSQRLQAAFENDGATETNVADKSEENVVETEVVNNSNNKEGAF